MNKQESDIMKILLQTPFINQRMLAEASGHSLGSGESFGERTGGSGVSG